MRLLRELNRGALSAAPQGLQILSAGDMSQGTVVSSSFDVEHTPLICIEAAWSAGSTPVGTLQLQGSVSGVNWFNVGSTVAVSGNTGAAQVTDANAGYLYARVLYTKTSGSGTLVAYAEAKGF